jgi:hypothetical protein
MPTMTKAATTAKMEVAAGIHLGTSSTRFSIDTLGIGFSSFFAGTVV